MLPSAREKHSPAKEKPARRLEGRAGQGGSLSPAGLLGWVMSMCPWTRGAACHWATGRLWMRGVWTRRRAPRTGVAHWTSARIWTPQLRTCCDPSGSSRSFVGVGTSELCAGRCTETWALGQWVASREAGRTEARPC